ncbi:hypothetical protein E1A91_D03G006400v1 [Gossypium mustelinum]|uniref:Ribosomal protein L7Ae/L30e/S12e/Gadd45 domain-containing protein n=1 Tax=Gossypium mustelinum TaxID=34275 RepID=A0A5D2VHA7_GOSMU|nr:hypothetical protein E1A91_D03G006400v1 [Gossypium mustelinum]
MVAAKKTKKTHESINNRLALVMKSGKYTLGYKIVFKSLRSSKGIPLLLNLEGLLNFEQYSLFNNAENDAVGQELQKQLEAAGTFPPSFLHSFLCRLGLSVICFSKSLKSYIPRIQICIE